MFCNVLKTQICRWGYDPQSSALTPNCTLTVFEHVVPEEPHGIFSVITPKLVSTVVLSHLFLNEKKRSIYAFSKKKKI